MNSFTDLFIRRPVLATVVSLLILLVGGVIGAQLGSRFGAKLHAEQLRAGLAILVLAVAVKLAFDLTVTPDALYSVAPL